MHWIYLLVAGLLEMVWVVGMKYSDGFTKLGWSALTLVTMVVSLVFLSKAMKVLPMGTAYAIWTGIGAVGGVVAGILLFSESSDWPRLLCVVLIVGGIMGLKLTSAH
ncbi:DMT family transporter [Chitinimonas sp. BJB300]|uniref:DMT family transporter n=1 Tax=Chitinimonas sp. BJB300 TaxID=1559339 RepID=UPI000C0D7B68|nr:quaternary ammonium compound efflux SMR transporter SugE [Chitinimonas sp. BJB300]PHV10437.1 quaternary ammonium compound-resistance protein SugE [Chitinimonas sp. BJB300]TSJ83265.1 quaternary ammonium compound efflux SMR transporter SugE [Chitinimonas sp. BJB300]